MLCLLYSTYKMTSIVCQLVNSYWGMDKLHVLKTIPSSKQYMSIMYKNNVKKGKCIFILYLKIHLLIFPLIQHIFHIKYHPCFKLKQPIISKVYMV